MRLYTIASSANGYKAELLLALLGRPYDRVEVDIFAGASRTPEFLAMNPAGRVPVLELDDGSFLPESNAILWHLARGTDFMPAALADQDRALAWLMFEQSEVEPVIGSARFWLQTGRDRARRDELGRRLDWARQTLALLERELSARAFLVGERVSVADLALYAYVHLAPEIDLPLPPAVAAWCARIAALPGYVPGALVYPASAQVAAPAPQPAPADDRYDTRMDNKYGTLTTIDIPAEVAAHEPWFNQTLSRINDSLLRLGIFGGEYHWHKHDHEDECFIVLSGELELDVADRGTIVLPPHTGYTVPRGVVHRTRARAKTVVLMIEAATVTPTGD